MSEFGLPEINTAGETQVYKLGIVGGTFDPIHYGHLLIAEQARTGLDLDSVVLIPTANPNFKQEIEQASGEDRLAMTSLAASRNDHFYVSDMEVARGGITYTADTLLKLKKIYPEGVEFYFIAGADSLISVATWENSDIILKLAHLVVTSRFDCDLKETKRILSERCPEARITYLEVPSIDISSSDIRRRSSEGRSIRYMMPDPVVDYIKDHKLYRG